MSIRTAAAAARLSSSPSRIALAATVPPIRYQSRPTSPTCCPTNPRRTFITLPGFGSGGDDTQRLTATRTLPYARDPLYELISDVDAYSSFVPYCSLSRVTAWSSPEGPSGRRWPRRADLHVGWGGFEEVFTSRLSCIPGVSVEAVSGPGAGEEAAEAASTIFKTLVTRWSLRPLPESKSSPLTEVNLDISYQFVNPLYAAVSAAVSDKVATMMIEAFEKQAQRRLASSPCP